jgi:hypothetical protein
MSKNYFSNPSISNSSLAAINPEQGGSPQKFKKFLEDNSEQKYSVSLERGSLIHLYCEHPDDFIISDVEKPTDLMCKWVEYAFNGLKRNNLDLVKGLDDDYIVFVKDTVKAYDNIKDKTKIVEKFKKEGQAYYDFLVKGDGKICMTAETGRIVTSCIDSLKTHPVAKSFLFEKNEFDDIEYYNELEIYWQERINIGNKESQLWANLPCKSMLDRVIIDFKNMIIRIPDIKSTSKPKSQFQESFEYYRYHRQHAFQRTALRQWLLTRTDRKITMEDIYKFEVHSYNIVVETIHPYQVGIYPLSKFWLKEGKEEMDSLLKRVTWHHYYGIWDTTMEEYANGGFLELKDKKIWLRN